MILIFLQFSSCVHEDIKRRREFRVNMVKEELMEHVKGCQSMTGILSPVAAQIHSEDDKAIHLQSRKTTLSKFSDYIQQRKASLSETPMPQDRTKYPMPVFSGMKGLGKTRMLEEWKSAFEGAGITGPSSAVIVTYGNGTGVCSQDRMLPIEASFGWRILHQLFVKQNFRDEDSSNWAGPGFLPANAKDMTLRLALEVVQGLLREVLITVPTDSKLSLFIGIDEYQAIPKGSEYERRKKVIEDAQKEKFELDDSSAVQLKLIRSYTYLWQLIGHFEQCRSIENLQIYPAFAGTKLGDLSIAGSSVPEMRRIPLPFLSPQGMEDAIRSGKNQNKLVNNEFRQELFFLGGLPRPSIAYANGPDTFDDVWHHYIASEWTITSKELLLLVAYAVSRKEVTQEDMPGIKNLKWYQLADQGLCLLAKDVVTIPYCIFRLAAAKASPTTLVEKCLSQNLCFLIDQVDKSLYVTEPWQQWEYFGAAFFALRVNSLILLNEGDRVPFRHLCEHAAINGCDQIVDLRPMEVKRITQHLSTELPKMVTASPSGTTIDWVNGDERSDGLVTYCLLNGTSGEGVDIFCALKLSDSKELLFYADQRKRVAKTLGPVSANEWIQRAAIIPRCLGEEADYVLGLFSLLSSYRHQPDTLFKDSFVLSYIQHKDFHGCLWSHPAASPCIDVNLDNMSTLKLLTSVAKIVDQIVERRKHSPFQDLEDFTASCSKFGCTLSEDDSKRCIVYC